MNLHNPIKKSVLSHIGITSEKPQVKPPIETYVPNKPDDPAEPSEYIEPTEASILEEYEHESPKGNQYSYLSDNILEQNYDFAIRPEPYKIRICLYRMIFPDGEAKPFLQFLLHLNANQEWDFPQYDYKPEEIAGRQDTSEFFMEKFKEELAEIVPLFSEIQMDRMLKGIVEHNDVIHVFFDITAISKNKDDYVWACIHEIYNLRKIGASPVAHSIEELFYRNPYILSIKDQDGPIEYPYVLFLCDKTEGFMGSSLSNVEDSDLIRLPRIPDDRMGDFFWFTSTPIQEGGNPRKFVVFIDEANTRFFEKKEEVSDTQDYPAIYFYEGDMQIWCIKSRMSILKYPNHYSNQ
jgi:hypothetical protein